MAAQILNQIWSKQGFFIRVNHYYREECTQPVNLLWILWPSILVQPDHELLTERENETLVTHGISTTAV